MSFKGAIGAFIVAVMMGGMAASAQDITVAAAADLQFVMQDLVTHFQKETGKTVKVTYGSSGNFFQQIQNGAPFDMFFSANLEYAKRLESAGLTEADSFYEYATGKIVIWVPKESRLDISSGIAALLSASIQKIAIANPQHAPYGQAAVAALKKGSVYDKVADKLVFGENISQTATFVASGSADAGIIALSLALSPAMKDKGRYVEIPVSEYSPIQQACVIMKASKQKETARVFLGFVKGQGASELFRNYGFAVPNDLSHP
jgi:molybdate transport system substrate-binding protein